MKKVCAAVMSVFLLLAASSIINAAPYTWVDVIDFNPDQYVGWWDSFDYSHDLTDNTPTPFTPFEDLIYSYTLNVSLYDDRGFFDLGEIAFIDQPGLIGDGLYNFSYANQDFGWSIAGLISLNLIGGLDVTIDSVYGDFYLASSTLTAVGDNATAPVPEPATLLLLGSGLVGLAGFRRKKS